MVISLLLFARAFSREPSWTLAGRLSLLTAAIVLSCFIAMAIPDLQEFRGLWQRIAELSIFSWLLLVVIKAVRQ